MKKERGETIMKKLFASLLAVMMLASMLVLPASAAGEYTITINGTAANHEYQAYQIFSGNLSSDGRLGDIAWGSGVNGSNLLAALKADPFFGDDAANLFSSCTDAYSVSLVVAAWSPDSANLDRFAEVVGENLNTLAGTSSASGTTYTIAGLNAGYYIIKDSNDAPEQDTGDAYTKYIIRVVRNVEVSPKGSVPTVSKTVHTAKDGTFREYEDVAMTYSVWFKLEGTIPTNYIDYAQYSYKFVDTLPSGLTYVTDSVIAYILHADDTTADIDPAKYTAVLTGQTLTVDFGNVKTSLPALLASDKIVVKYSATLDGDAPVIGGTGNVNSVYLLYSNDPNQSANDPNPSLGKTATDTASVYTFRLDVTKVDGIDTTKVLPNAQFRLYRNESDTVRRYAKVDATGMLEASVYDVNDASTLTTDAQGKFSVIGLDAGIFYLEEIKAPDGYNTMKDPVRVTITPEYVSNVLSSLKSDVDGVPGTGYADTGIVPVLVKNNASATLPSTGGMGTTLFYVVGVVLMLGAAAVIIAKKRQTK